MYLSKIHLLLLGALFLAACGGGGGGNEVDPGGDPFVAQATSFRHTALPANSVRGMTFVDHPICNDNPAATLIVTPAYIPADGGGLGVYINHNIGVEYDLALGQWALLHLDGSDVLSGAVFHVTVANGTGIGDTEFFTHIADGSAAHPIGTYFSHAAANGRANAVILVTANVTPVDGVRMVHDHPLGVAYVDAEGQWVVYNRDWTPMPAGAAFNVAVVALRSASPFTLAGLHHAIAATCSAGSTWLEMPTDQDLILHATVVHRGAAPPYGTNYGVVNLDGARWGIFNQNATPVTPGPYWNLAIAR